MKTRKTSRVLNDNSYFFGLSYNDISAAGLFLLGLILLFKFLEIKNMIGALFLTIFLLSVLVPIRMSFRKKIIRDSFKYILSHGVKNVSKNRRNSTI